jgi:hypothetical protein
MLNCAIDQLGEKRDAENQLRLAFYLAARSELLRGSPESLADRVAVRDLSQQLGSAFFGWFMKVEEATVSRTRARWGGSTSPYATGGGTDPDPGNPFITPIGRTLRALPSIGVVLDDLSAKDHKFLEHATLRQLLEKHGIRYAP